MRAVKVERRQHPRVDQKLPVDVSTNGYYFTTVTQNISCLGAYCHINKYVPPFTKVAIKLNLPIISRAGQKDSNADCKGVVVRTEDVPSGGFNVAIFFNDIKDSQRHKISQYINQFLPKTSSDLARS
jgi:hypothetical protein